MREKFGMHEHRIKEYDCEKSLQVHDLLVGESSLL